jgi:hypothetical protein
LLRRDGYKRIELMKNRKISLTLTQRQQQTLVRKKAGTNIYAKNIYDKHNFVWWKFEIIKYERELIMKNNIKEANDDHGSVNSCKLWLVFRVVQNERKNIDEQNEKERRSS